MEEALLAICAIDLEQEEVLERRRLLRNLRDGSDPFSMSQEQLQCYIAYMRGNTGLLSEKNNPTQRRLLEEMWVDVANKLNALRGPTRTPAKWKESLANWRNQLRSRARRQLGGGPKPAELDDFDSQALEVLGLIAVEGIPAQELGFEENVNSPTEVLEVILHSDDEPCSPVVSNSSLCSSSNAALPNGASRSSSPSRRKYKRGTSQEVVEVVLKRMKKREAFEERMFEQLKATTGAVAKLGEGMLALAAALKKPLE